MWIKRVLFLILIFTIYYAVALEVITDPYDSIDYDAINVYHYKSDCDCPEIECKTSFDDLFKNY